jgi:hypothetical protein
MQCSITQGERGLDGTKRHRKSLAWSRSARYGRRASSYAGESDVKRKEEDWARKNPSSHPIMPLAYRALRESCAWSIHAAATGSSMQLDRRDAISFLPPYYHTSWKAWCRCPSDVSFFFLLAYLRYNCGLSVSLLILAFYTPSLFPPFFPSPSLTCVYQLHTTIHYVVDG